MTKYNGRMKAYLVARVSTEDQKDALPGQVNRLVDYAKRNSLNAELIQIKESAYKGNRDEFKSVISKIEASKGPVIVVFDKIDRYTRDSSAEEVRVLQRLYRAGKIELHFPSDNLVIHQGSPATDIMRLGLGVVLAQYYSDAISDNVKRRIEQKIRDGEWIGWAPFGYVNVDLPNGKKHVQVHKESARIVKLVYELYARGDYSLLMVRKKIQDDYDTSIGTAQLDRILKNPFYFGEMQIKGEQYPHKYETIITKKQFQQVAAVRQGYAIKPRRYGGLPYPYRGLIDCSECGCKITFEKKKGKYIYGHCTQFNGKHGAAYVNEDTLTEQLQGVFNGISIPEDDYAKVIKALKESFEKEEKNKDEIVDHLHSEITKYNVRKNKNYEAYLDGLISRETFSAKDHEFTASQKKLEERLSTFELSPAKQYEEISNLLKISKEAPQLFKKADFEEKRSMINLVLSNLQLEEKQLRWELKKPFDLMAFCSKNANWLPTIRAVITVIKQDCHLPATS